MFERRYEPVQILEFRKAIGCTRKRQKQEYYTLAVIYIVREEMLMSSCLLEVM